MDTNSNESRALFEGDDPLEASLIELIICASECSEDEMEVADQLDAVLASGRVQLVHDSGLARRTAS
jgi:hypothetical protein